MPDHPTPKPEIVILAAPEGCTVAGRLEVFFDLRATLPPGSVGFVVPHGWQRLDVDRMAVEAEREACAALVDDMGDVYEAPEIAKTIRARGAT